MSRIVSTGSTRSRPSAISTKSFTRFEPAHSPSSPGGRLRASTVSAASATRTSLDDDQSVFNRIEDEELETASPRSVVVTDLPEHFDELPIELASLTDRFVESLSTKSYTEPPDIEQIEALFQEFYTRASSSISIHISALRSRLNREASPTPSRTPTRPKPSITKSIPESLAPQAKDGSQQMLTATEVSERRKQRRLLEYKKLMLEEAVERRACERVYDKIWRHKSTLDEVRDEKLRSKTAALALVGIGLKDLGVELDSKSTSSIEDIQESLAPARESLIQMNAEHHPLGKLQHLTTAHQAIVNTLYTLHGSSSSADEILPTLIYTLITSPVEGINIISNLYFVQRFRAANKIDGEAAYCMTNLEAAIGFLEDVDLASLRADEMPEGPKRVASGPGSPVTERSEPFPSLTVSTIPTASPTTTVTTSSAVGKTSVPKDKPAKTPPSPMPMPMPSPRHQRTLSDLLRPVHSANEAVRISAKEGVENISNALDNSFKFLFGKLKEHSADPTKANDITLPKTLDEARKLVNRPVSSPENMEDGAAISETSSVTGEVTSESPSTLEKEPSKPLAEDKLMALFGNRKAQAARERSVDSSKSNTSSRRVAFVPGTTGTDSPQQKANASPASNAVTPNNPLDSVKNLGSSLNPLNHFGNAFGGGFRGFGRSNSTPPLPPSASTGATPTTTAQNSGKTPRDGSKLVPKEAVGEPTADEEPKLAVYVEKPEEVATKIRSISPPIRRFLETEDAGTLRIRDVSELLQDYQRLAAILSELAAAPASENTS